MKLVMKQICKDAYKFSRDQEVLQLISKSLTKKYFDYTFSAQSEKTPVSVLVRLSEPDLDENDWTGVQQDVANNVNTPLYILEKLSHHKHYSVRISVAYNQNISHEIISLLSKDSYEDVKAALISNPIVPIEVLLQMRNDNENSQYIQYRLVDNITYIKYLNDHVGQTKSKENPFKAVLTFSR